MIWAPVAQLDRASASGVEGRGFESRRVYQFFLQNKHKKSPQKSENSRLQARLALEFFIFAWCQLLTTDVIFLRVAFAALRLAAGLRPCVESRRVYQLFKNHCKKIQKRLIQVNLHAVFLFFTVSGCFAPGGFFMAGCLRCAQARCGLSPLRRIPPGVPFFLQNKHKKSPHDWCQLFTTDVIFLWVAFATLRLAAGLRPCVESRRVYQFFCKINTKNHRKNQKTQDCKQDLLLSFLFLLGVSCLQLT